MFSVHLPPQNFTVLGLGIGSSTYALVQVDGVLAGHNVVDGRLLTGGWVGHFCDDMSKGREDRGVVAGNSLLGTVSTVGGIGR